MQWSFPEQTADGTMWLRQFETSPFGEQLPRDFVARYPPPPRTAQSLSEHLVDLTYRVSSSALRDCQSAVFHAASLSLADADWRQGSGALDMRKPDRHCEAALRAPVLARHHCQSAQQSPQNCSISLCCAALCCAVLRCAARQYFATAMQVNPNHRKQIYTWFGSRPIFGTLFRLLLRPDSRECLVVALSACLLALCTASSCLHQSK